MANESVVPLAGEAGDPVPVPRRRLALRAGPIGLVLLVVIAGPCFVTLPWAVHRYNEQRLLGEQDLTRQPPSWSEPMGTDGFGRSLLWRCLMGGAISLGVGIAAAGIAVTIGVTWGALAGYIGGRVDALMMRIVDVLYGLPYILMVVLLDLALSPVFDWLLRGVFGLWMEPGRASSVGRSTADVVTLLVAIGAVSWLTMARVIRGQVLSLREQPFIEAARACGVGPGRILRVHLLPNLVGPMVVYTTLTVPQAILQESFLSFLGIGVQAPLPSWGNLAAEGVEQLSGLGLAGPAAERWALLREPIELLQRFGASVQAIEWWLVLFPCLLLGLTLMALNFLGDDLRARFDPKSG
ncbi:MAG: ABC transporter permease [Phycisphaeraceae bacterium]